MQQKISIKRTDGGDPDFQSLIAELDHELWDELKEDQSLYSQYNHVPNIKTVILIYLDEQPVACGCFKHFDERTVEIKRMFVKKSSRGMGLSKKVLSELEQWAVENNYANAVLETSIHFETAKRLYLSDGYKVISNYGQYAGLPESICMKKELR
jgi:putative acetyltransferase